MNRFKQPQRLPDAADTWVQGGKAAETPQTAAAPTGKPAEGKMARLSVDLPAELHARFKAACALHGKRMGEEITRLVESWTQNHERGG